MAWEVSQAQRVALARRIEGKMRTKGWTQVKLADAAGYTDRQTIRPLSIFATLSSLVWKRALRRAMK